MVVADYLDAAVKIAENRMIAKGNIILMRNRKFRTAANQFLQELKMGRGMRLYLNHQPKTFCVSIRKQFFRIIFFLDHLPNRQFGKCFFNFVKMGR